MFEEWRRRRMTMNNNIKTHPINNTPAAITPIKYKGNDSDDDDTCGLVTFTLSSVFSIVRDDEIVEVDDDDECNVIGVLSLSGGNDKPLNDVEDIITDESDVFKSIDVVFVGSFVIFVVIFVVGFAVVVVVVVVVLVVVGLSIKSTIAINSSNRLVAVSRTISMLLSCRIKRTLRLPKLILTPNTARSTLPPMAFTKYANLTRRNVKMNFANIFQKCNLLELVFGVNDSIFDEDPLNMVIFKYLTVAIPSKPINFELAKTQSFLLKKNCIKMNV